jgi:hypothetical protein
MNTQDQHVRELLRRALAPVTDAELKRDLWPQMLDRLHETPVRVSRLDWVLVALSCAGCIAFPRVILALLFHL